MRNIWGEQTDSERGISPVVGIALLVGVTLITAILVFASLTGFLALLEEPPAVFVQSGDVSAQVAGDEITDQHLVLTHQGGQSVPIDEVEVVLDTGERRIRMPLAEMGSVSGHSWTAGEELKLDLRTEEVCTGADEIEVSLLQQTGQRTYIVGEDTVPVRTPRFAIKDGRVVPRNGYTAHLRLLGTAFTYGAHGPAIDVTTDIVVGNETYNPWPGNVNDGGNPRSQTFTDRSAGAGISVIATGDPNGEYVEPRTRSSKDTSNGWVSVLRDGDKPPTIQGYGDQANVAAFLAPYVAENGTLDLANNEAIFLFELGDSQTGDAADYQDVVVLATLEPAVTRNGENGQTNTSRGVMCPESE